MLAKGIAERIIYLLVGLVVGCLIMSGIFSLLTHQDPAVPILPTPTAITVTLYPYEGSGALAGVPVDIPPEKLESVYRLLIPETYVRERTHEFIMPIAAKAKITASDGTETSVVVRDYGHNPAMVTMDGWNYFVARSCRDVHAGAYELRHLVFEVADENGVSW